MENYRPATLTPVSAAKASQKWMEPHLKLKC